MRLPEPATFQKMKPSHKASTLSTFLRNTLDNEHNVLKRLKAKEDFYLKKQVLKDEGECLLWERNAKSERKKCGYVMESIATINDITREIVQQNMKDITCNDHHPHRFSKLDYALAQKIAESTNGLIKSICSYLAKKAHSLEKESKAIITKLKNSEEDNQDAENVDDRHIELLKKKECKFDEFSTNIYWFANNVAEKQRQTYGVYPSFHKQK